MVFHNLHAYAFTKAIKLMDSMPANIQALFDAQSYLSCKQLYYRWLMPH